MRSIAISGNSDTGNPFIFGQDVESAGEEGLPADVQFPRARQASMTTPTLITPAGFLTVRVGSLATHSTDPVIFFGQSEESLYTYCGASEVAHSTHRLSVRSGFGKTAAIMAIGGAVAVASSYWHPPRHVVFAGSIESSYYNQIELMDEISSAMTALPIEELEDGMTASLGEVLSLLLKRHGDRGVAGFSLLIGSGALQTELASHALRWFGRIKDSATYYSRLSLLIDSLSSQEPEVRDGASLGLAALGNRQAIPALRRAIEREPRRGLRSDMQQVLVRLEAG